jgi:hypothetical protein
MQLAKTIIAPQGSGGNSFKSLRNNEHIIELVTSGACSVFANGRRHRAYIQHCQMELVVTDGVHRDLAAWWRRNPFPRVSGSLSLSRERNRT